MKMNKPILKAISLFVLVPLFLGGCINDLFDQRDREYDGEKLLEFRPATVTVDEREDAADEPVDVSSNVQLVSPLGTAQSNLSISYVVDDSSTAVAGEHYTLESSSPLTIPEGGTSTTLELNVTADDLEDGEVRTLYVSLQGTGDVGLSENYKTLTVNIRGDSDSAAD